jgi:hypothetical protein
MKKIISGLVCFLSAGAFAGGVRVVHDSSEVPSSCTQSASIGAFVEFSPKQAGGDMRKLQLRVLKECKKWAARADVDVMLLVGFEKSDRSDGGMRLRCTAHTYYCK